jgi:hypothetical protein
MRLYLVRIDNHLVPHGDESLAEFEGLPFDKELQAEVTQPRNLAHHKLFWTLCARIGAGIGKDAEWVERAFKVETGHYDVFRYGGQEKLILRSISFAKLDQLAFNGFFEQCVQIAYSIWNINPADVADLLVKTEQHG